MSSFTATVTAGDDEPLSGWDVVFARDGDPRPAVVTDADGRARITESSSTDSISTISASVSIDGCTAPAPATIDHYWWLPTLDLEPKSTTSPARGDVTFTADLTRSEGEDTAAVPGRLIRFTMTSQDCDLPVVVREDRTNSDGIASVSLTRDGPSIDRVVAQEVGVVGPASDITTHTWGAPEPPPLSIILDQASTTSRAGTKVTVTGVVHDADRPNGRAASGVPVTLIGTTPDGSNPRTTNTQGEVQFTFTGTSTSPTTLSAATPFGCGVVLSPPIAHGWFIPTLTLTPPSGTTTTGKTATITARLAHGGDGLSNQEIELTIDNSVAGVSTQKLKGDTGAGGTVDFSWSRPRPGVDALMARETIAVQPQQQTATRTWKQAATVDAATSSRRLRSPHLP